MIVTNNNRHVKGPRDSTIVARSKEHVMMMTTPKHDSYRQQPPCKRAKRLYDSGWVKAVARSMEHMLMLMKPWIKACDQKISIQRLCVSKDFTKVDGSIQRSVHWWWQCWDPRNNDDDQRKNGSRKFKILGGSKEHAMILKTICNFMMESTVQRSKNKQFCHHLRLPLVFGWIVLYLQRDLGIMVLMGPDIFVH